MNKGQTATSDEGRQRGKSSKLKEDLARPPLTPDLTMHKLVSTYTSKGMPLHA